MRVEGIQLLDESLPVVVSVVDQLILCHIILSLLGRVGMPLLRELVDFVLRRADPSLKPQLILLVRPVGNERQLPPLIHHLLALHLFKLDYFFELRRNRRVLLDEVEVNLYPSRPWNGQAEFVENAAVAGGG